MNYRIAVTKTFSAAHALRGYKGRCEHLHGHNWKVKAMVAGTRLNDIGMVMDFGDLRAVMDRILSRLDHQFLNEVPPFDHTNPTAESIARYILDNLSEELRPLAGTGVLPAGVEVWESETSSALVTPV